MEVYVEGLRNVLSALPGAERFIYVSSTGVYGQSEGEWVDETSPCQPTREGGRACLAAERVLQDHWLGAKAVILRMGGLYGPGRIPRRRDLEAGQPIAAAEHGFLNLIHVEDAASIVLAAEARAPLPSLYAVTDNSPVLRGDYFRELTRLAGLPEPRFAPASSSPRAERATTDKRISNRKMRTELQIQLRYPTHREGLAAILASE
jgi:nucleoside-diphosphate-sugar epimerase